MTSSPKHAKSNGKAESAVKVAKKIFKKAHRDNKDPWLALLDQRNTPTQGVNSSPVQRLMSRRTRTLLPVSELLWGQEVRVAGQRNKVWEAGTCVQKLSDRSYLVEVNGNTLRRNRQALRPKKDTQMTGETTIAETKPPSSVPAETEGQTALRSTNHSDVTTPVKVSDTPQQNLSVPLKSTRTRIVKAPVRCLSV